MDKLGVLKRQPDAAVGFALAKGCILGGVGIRIPAAQLVGDGMEIVSC